MIKQTRTENGMVRGVSAVDPRIIAYKGVPFAAPPVGNLRWKAPHQNKRGDSSDDEPAIGFYFAEMNDDMLTVKEPLKEMKILDENGRPLTIGDTDRRFFEAPWVHKYNGKYYLSYSTGETHYLCYAESGSPAGPFIYKGRILEPVKGWTTHQAIVEFKGKWYLFYHDAAISGVNHQRNAMFRELDISGDGTIKTMKPYDD